MEELAQEMLLLTQQVKQQLQVKVTLEVGLELVVLVLHNVIAAEAAVLMLLDNLVLIIMLAMEVLD